MSVAQAKEQMTTCLTSWKSAQMSCNGKTHEGLSGSEHLA